MQRDARAADLFDQRVAARLNFFQIRGAKWLVCRARENYVGHFEIAHWPIVGRRKRVDLFCDAERRLSYFVVWPDVADHGRINRVPENDKRIVTRLNGVVSVRKCARHHDKRIGRADEEAVFSQCADLGTQLRDCIAQLTLPCGSGSCERVFIFCAFQSLFGRGEIRVRRGRFLWPAITRGRLEISGCAGTDRHPISV